MFNINIEGEEIQVNVEKQKRKTRNSIRQKIVSSTPLFCVAIYLLLGFCKDAWHPGWVVFLAIPIVPTLLYAFGDNFKKNFMSVLTLVVIGVYVVLGVCFNIWHPTWIMFFIIPILGIFID